MAKISGTPLSTMKAISRRLLGLGLVGKLGENEGRELDDRLMRSYLLSNLGIMTYATLAIISGIPLSTVKAAMRRLLDLHWIVLKILV